LNPHGLLAHWILSPAQQAAFLALQSHFGPRLNARAGSNPASLRDWILRACLRSPFPSETRLVARQICRPKPFTLAVFHREAGCFARFSNFQTPSKNSIGSGAAAERRPRGGKRVALWRGCCVGQAQFKPLLGLDGRDQHDLQAHEPARFLDIRVFRDELRRTAGLSETDWRPAWALTAIGALQSPAGGHAPIGIISVASGLTTRPGGRIQSTQYKVRFPTSRPDAQPGHLQPPCIAAFSRC